MDRETLANIKTLALDMINEANSGHPGIVLSASPIIYTLYKYHLNINPINPNWYNRDRFIMSSGHGSALLYATLFMCGYDLTLDDLKKFRSINSKTPGHPEYNVTPGVECTTGPLGEGIATAVGIALGEKILKERAKLNNKKSIIDFNTYVLVSDGDLMEGISYEACSLAGTLKLNNLIILYDSNNMSLDGTTDNTFKEAVKDRFEALGFDTFKVSDGNSIKQLNLEITKAKRSKKPAFIEIKTHLGYGSKLQDTKEVHGTPLTKEDLFQLKKKLSIPNEPFYVDEDKKQDLISFIANRVGDKYNNFVNLYNVEIKSNLDTKYKDIKFFFEDETYGISNINWKNTNTKSLRNINKYVMNMISKNIPSFIGGSADVSSSTKTYIDDSSDIVYKNYKGKNIHYGVREQASSAISNGLALLNFRPFISTFLAFSDYLKPGIRMSALMNLPVTYIFTHDSIAIGKDGPTHEPVEQLTALRDIPNLCVYRPVDLKETIGSYQSILSHNNPSALIISRGNTNSINSTSATNTQKGGYVVREVDNYIATLVASGTDLITALKISYALEKSNINVRVVSMPSLDIFLKQTKEYKESILKDKKIIVIEASTALHYTKITDYNNIINIESFGTSASSEDVLEYANFDIASIYKKVYNLIKK